MKAFPTQRVPTVAVYMVTYNHELFIDQAIESVISQKTSFDYHLFIGEDCSTDQTRKKCEAWQEKFPERITLLESAKNLGINKNATRVFEACIYSGAEYIALLEGDDYWTDHQKLEKQIQLLRSNPEAVGSYHNTYIERKNGEVSIIYKQLPPIIQHEDAISKYAPFHTSSFIFKSKYYCRPQWFQKIDSVDLAMYALCAQFGPLIGINECMSHYRHHEGGLTSSLDHKNYFHQKRVLLHQYLQGKIHQHHHQKSNQLIALHQKEIKNQHHIDQNIVIGFAPPSSGDIDNSKFIQMSLDAEIVPFTLIKNGVRLMNLEMKKKWWVFNGEKWLLGRIKKTFKKNIDVLYIQDLNQLSYLHQLSSHWRTPIITDFSVDPFEKNHFAFQNTKIHHLGNTHNESLPSQLKLRPQFLKSFNQIKNHIATINLDEETKKQFTLTFDDQQFRTEHLTYDCIKLNEILFIRTLLCIVIFEGPLFSHTQLIQLLSQDVKVIAPESYFQNIPAFIRQKIIFYNETSEIHTIIQKIVQNPQSEFFDWQTLSLAQHGQYIDHLIKNITEK